MLAAGMNGRTITVNVQVAEEAAPEQIDKVKFTVSSKLDSGSVTEVTAAVDDNYVAKAVIPKGAMVNAGNAKIKLEMTDIASLGIIGTRSHELEINTGISGLEVNLIEAIPGLISLKNATVNGTFGGNEVTYTLIRNDGDDNYEWVMTPNTTQAARDAWQYVAGLVEVYVHDKDDSQIFIPKGTYLIVGNDKLVFTEDLSLENVTGDLGDTEEAIRAAVTLDKDVVEKASQVELYMPKGAKLRIGQSEISLKEAIPGIKVEIDGMDATKIDTVLEEMQAATGIEGMIKGSLDFLNMLAAGMNGRTITVNVQESAQK